MSGIAICVPYSRMVHPSWASHYATLAYPPNIRTHHCTVMPDFPNPPLPVEKARQQLVEMALERDPKYLFFIDDDTIIPQLGLQYLLYTMENADKDVMAVTGVYVTKEEVPSPVIYRKNGSGPAWDWKCGDVFEVEGCGMGCFLVKAEVFKHLKAPYFRFEEMDRTDGDGRMVFSEDLYFCRTVREAGFKILANGGVLCAHWDDETKKFYTLPANSYPMREPTASNL